MLRISPKWPTLPSPQKFWPTTILTRIFDYPVHSHRKFDHIRHSFRLTWLMLYPKVWPIVSRTNFLLILCSILLWKFDQSHLLLQTVCFIPPTPADSLTKFILQSSHQSIHSHVKVNGACSHNFFLGFTRSTLHSGKMNKTEIILSYKIPFIFKHGAQAQPHILAIFAFQRNCELDTDSIHNKSTIENNIDQIIEVKWWPIISLDERQHG